MSWLPDWITGYDAANADAAAAADATLRGLNADRQASGGYTAAQWAQVQRDYASQESFDPAAQRDSIDSAFAAGLEDGRQNVKSFFNGAVWQFLKTIPLVVWIGAGIALFVWMGGLSLLKGRLAKT